MTSERAEGYVIDETKLNGKSLNQLLGLYQQELTKRADLAKAIPFHRSIVEQAFRKRKADFYLSFSFTGGQSESLFGDLSRRQVGDVIKDIGLTIGFFNGKQNNSFAQILTHEGRELDYAKSIAQNLFKQEELPFKQTKVSMTSLDNKWIYSAGLDNSQVSKIDFSRLEGKCTFWDFGIGTSLDFEHPYLVSKGKGESSSMATVISLATDYTPEATQKWIFAAMTDFFCNEDQSSALHNSSRAFRRNIVNPLSEIRVPDTCISIGRDYSGKHLHVFTPETKIEKVVEYAVGHASDREVGMGTIADTTKRLVGLYQGLKSNNPLYAQRLKQITRAIHDSNPHSENAWLIRDTLNYMK